MHEQGGYDDRRSVFAACGHNLWSCGHRANRSGHHEAANYYRAHFDSDMGELGCLCCRDYPGLAWIFSISRLVPEFALLGLVEPLTEVLEEIVHEVLDFVLSI